MRVALIALALLLFVLWITCITRGYSFADVIGFIFYLYVFCLAVFW